MDENEDLKEQTQCAGNASDTERETADLTEQEDEQTVPAPIDEVATRELPQKLSKKRTILYALLMLSVTVIWGAAFPFTTFILDKGVPSFLFLAGRFLLAAILLFAFDAVRNKGIHTEKKEAKTGLLIGVVVFAAYVLQTFGLVYTSPDKSGLLTGLYVLFIPLAKCIIKRRFQWKPIFDAVLCLIGILVFYEVWNQSMSMNLGDILTIGCAVCFAAQMILLEKYAHRFELVRFTAFQLLTIGVLSLACSLIFEMDQYSNMDVKWFIISSVVLGILSSAIANLVQNFVQTKLKATTTSLIACSESVFAVLFSLAWGYSSLSLFYVIGALIIMLAIISGCVLKKNDTL